MAETRCCGGSVLRSWCSDSMDSSLASIGLMRDGLDVDSMRAVEADSVEGCLLPEAKNEDIGFN